MGTCEFPQSWRSFSIVFMVRLLLLVPTYVPITTALQASIELATHRNGTVEEEFPWQLPFPEPFRGWGHKTSESKPKASHGATCQEYMMTTGCNWTNEVSCPGQKQGARGMATNDGSDGFRCCCTRGLWRQRAPAERRLQTKPHILFILMDDLGWSDISINSDAPEDRMHTPSIKRLADEGLVLERHYAHKFCSPTRSAIQSGRAPIHVNVLNSEIMSHNPQDAVGGYQGMPTKMTGIASVMKKAGYKTHMVGKWDIGVATADHLPAARGYDSSLIYFMHTNGRWDFKDDPEGCGRVVDLWEHDEQIPHPGRPAAGLVNPHHCDAQHQDGCVYEDELFEKRVTSIIQNHRTSEPLFLFWATAAVHGPYEPPDGEVEKVHSEVYGRMSGAVQLYWSSKTKYLGMLGFVDGAIGRVVDLLQQKDMYQDTLIVFSSDNGGVTGFSNEPLRGGKFSNFEGGIRVCAFVSGGLLPEERRGQRANGLVAAWDWYATFANLAGVGWEDDAAKEAKLPAVDSIDVWPYIAGQRPQSPRQHVEIGTNAGGYATNGRRSGQPMVGGLIQQDAGKLWKLVLGDAPGQKLECLLVHGPSHGPSPEGYDCEDFKVCGSTPETGCLFDLNVDPAEEQSLAAKHPDTFGAMLKKIEELNETVYAPNRGRLLAADCDAMRMLHSEHGGFLGPFTGEGAE